jgi:uncharacterized protein DUF3987
VKAASIDLLRKLAEMAPKLRSSTNNGNGDGHSLFNVGEYLARHGVLIQREQNWQGGERRLILEHCPFNPEHKATSAAVLQFADGAIAFKCQHNSCAGKKWDDVRELFEPGYLERRRMTAEGDEVLRSIHHQLNTKHRTDSENTELPVLRLVEEDPEQTSKNSFPESAWTGLFADWRNAVSASTEASLESLWSVFLLACGLVIGRRVWRSTPRPLFPNFYILLLGQTGDARKSTCLWLATEFLNRIGEDFKSLDGIVSTEGLIEALAGREETKALIYADEFRALLSVARRKGTQDILPRLNGLYYCPEKSSVDRVKKPTIAIRPFVSVITGTPQEYVEDLLCDLDITGGFLNRFIIITGDEQAPKPIVKVPSADEWDDLAMRTQTAIDKTSGNIEFSSEALDRWRGFYVDWRTGRRKLGHRKAQLTARLFEHVLKIATVYAVLNGEDTINLDTLNIAVEIGLWIEANTIRLFTTVGMDQFGKCEHAILTVLKKASGGRMWRRDLQQEMGGRRFNAELFNRALRALEMNDRITCHDMTTSAGRTRSVVQYVER